MPPPSPRVPTPAAPAPLLPPPPPPPLLLLLLLLLAAAAAPRAAALSLPTHFASSMVLQRDAPSALWGRDAPGASVTVTLFGAPLPPATCDAAGRFSVALPPMPANGTPGAVRVASSSGAPPVTLTDVVVGDCFVCSGQSNAAVPVSWMADYAGVLARADALGARLRMLQVATLDAYTLATAPQDNFTASIPWSRAAAASVGAMSALCYLFGAQAAEAHPDVPIGLIANPWGGVPIQVYMSPAALAECTVGGDADSAAAAASSAELHALRAAAAGERALMRAVRGGALGATPTVHSCLYYSMMYPILSIPVTAFLWYQASCFRSTKPRGGCLPANPPALRSATLPAPSSPNRTLVAPPLPQGEANAQNGPVYECLQRAFIADLRRSWAAAGAAPALPFVFVQLACWPTGSAPGMLSAFRAAQAAQQLQQPRTGMVVSADLCDPAGAFHPIHPPWKEELARRAWLWADNEIYGNASSPRAGPAVTGIEWHAWQPDWGDYHFGSGAGSYVCESTGEFTCGGIVLRFDRPVALRGFFAPPPAGATDLVYGFAQGAASGLMLAQNASAAAWSQPVVLTGLAADGLSAQLNVTVSGERPPPFNARVRGD